MPAEAEGKKSHSLIASDRVEGTLVHRRGGKDVGKIERLMIDKLSGNVAYAVLSFGGFLGFGSKRLPIPWTRLTYNPDAEAYEIDLSDDDLKKAPSYEAGAEFDWGDRSEEIRIHNFYQSNAYWGT